ncbi:very short patch repair endonuclease [Yoonia sediminilitoris]|uniref:T/G mismatch-specific endonuclease n=1 Tax=Yoonia sediminilitoris TaxID=1286148 RepID=A0A2T6KF12_9RHOB|nr:very short patch repair endonuclease [Yoonia sediminilitoris]PUB13722.1 T/G mismatch-specific endonuclease [Yoonia sediminilitoris]RCW94892.1 T/G mismatch-specific endonuclease [Yoonia sediminilitoris]
MAAVRGADTRPEMIIRKALHARGFRYRLHAKDLPGKPDLILPRYTAAVFVHGCFWHGHNCPLFRWPKTREEFWRDKIGRNQTRDVDVRCQLWADGWRVAVVWECALKSKGRLPLAHVIDSLSVWLSSDAKELSIEGRLIDESTQ